MSQYELIEGRKEGVGLICLLIKSIIKGKRCWQVYPLVLTRVELQMKISLLGAYNKNIARVSMHINYLFDRRAFQGILKLIMDRQLDSFEPSFKEYKQSSFHSHSR